MVGRAPRNSDKSVRILPTNCSDDWSSRGGKISALTTWLLPTPPSLERCRIVCFLFLSQNRRHRNWTLLSLGLHSLLPRIRAFFNWLSHKSKVDGTKKCRPEVWRFDASIGRRFDSWAFCVNVVPPINEVMRCGSFSMPCVANWIVLFFCLEFCKLISIPSLVVNITLIEQSSPSRWNSVIYASLSNLAVPRW